MELNIEAGLKLAGEVGLEDVVVHAPYIINLANTVKLDTFLFGVEFLAKELVRAEALHSKVVILHPGYDLVSDYEGVMRRFDETAEEGSKKKSIPPYKDEIRLLLSDNI